MKKKKTLLIAAAVVLIAAAAVGAFLYFAFFRNAGKTIEAFKHITDGTTFSVSAECKLNLDPVSTDAKLAVGLAQRILEEKEVSAVVSGEGKIQGTNLETTISAGIPGKAAAVTDAIFVDNKLYFGIDKAVSLIAGGLSDNFVFKLAYAGLIENRYVSWEQLEELIYYICGEKFDLSEISVSWEELLLFFAKPEHLFDPKLWSSVKVTSDSEGYSTYEINADYFKELAGISGDSVSAQLSFKTDKAQNVYDIKLAISLTDDKNNKLTANVTASLKEQSEAADIKVPALLLTDSQIDELKALADTLGAVRQAE